LFNFNIIDASTNPPPSDDLLVTNEIWLLVAGQIRLPVKEFRLLVADELVEFQE
jgi:hypothetical protein